MSRPDIGFPPIKIDSGENIHIITGVSGELLKVDSEINIIGNISKPFPSSITSSTIVGEIWIGAWVERELREARMAALDINDDWLDGGLKSELRSGNVILHPNSNIWSQLLDAEPMGISKIGETLCFSAKNKGIYRIDIDSNDINSKYITTDKFYAFTPHHQSHYDTAIEMFKSKPYIGNGTKTFRFECLKINPKSCSTHPHNTYIQLLSENGLLGFIPVLLVFIILCYILLKDFIFYYFKRIKTINDANLCLIICFFVCYIIQGIA